MARYAVIENNIVINMIEWEGPDVAPIEWPEGTIAVPYESTTDVQIGYLYDPETGKFTNPNPPESGDNGSSTEVVE